MADCLPVCLLACHTCLEEWISMTDVTPALLKLLPSLYQHPPTGKIKLWHFSFFSLSVILVPHFFSAMSFSSSSLNLLLISFSFPSLLQFLYLFLHDVIYLFHSVSFSLLHYITFSFFLPSIFLIFLITLYP